MTRASAQKRASPFWREINAQCPPCRGATTSTCALLASAGIGKTCVWNEGIALRGQDQRGHANVRRDTQRARSLVVIRSAAESAICRRDDVVKIAYGTHAGHRLQIEFPGKEFRLSPHAILESGDKIPLVQKISRQGDGVRAYRPDPCWERQPTMPSNCRGADPASSPAIFITRFPPIEYPAKKIPGSESRSMSS